MAYESKKALLLSMGKNPDDRNLVKRMIERWEVYEEWGMYYLVSEEWVVKKEKKSESKVGEIKEEKVEVDNKELEELRKKNEELIVAYKKVAEKYNKLLDRLKEEQKKSGWELCNHLIFFYNKFQEWKKFVDGKAFWQAMYNNTEHGSQDTTEAMKPEIYERYKFTYWEIEKAECKIVEEIIAQKEKENAELPF